MQVNFIKSAMIKDLQSQQLKVKMEKYLADTLHFHGSIKVTIFKIIRHLSFLLLLILSILLRIFSILSILIQVISLHLVEGMTFTSVISVIKIRAPTLISLTALKLLKEQYKTVLKEEITLLVPITSKSQKQKSSKST